MPLYKEETYYTVEYTEYPTGVDAEEDFPDQIICVVTIIIAILGLVGNGKVIWLLGFRLKRNPFTTYILNLAIADLGSLLHCVAMCVAILISDELELIILLQDLFLFTYSVSLYLLTVISLERCLSVLFPIWHRCHRPERASGIVSVFLWGLGALLSGMNILFYHLWNLVSSITMMNIICSVNFLIFAPLMLGSTLTLFIRICGLSGSRQPARVHKAILITLLCFIAFAIPLSIAFFTHLYEYHESFTAVLVAMGLASINSSMNPLIYYLVGTGRKRQLRESLKIALQRVFMDETDSGESVAL